MISKNLQESSTIQNISVNLLSVITVIITNNSLFYSIIKNMAFPDNRQYYKRLQFV